jgi:hypothetical protein
MKSERGAILVHVAIALVALTAFSAFVIDQGMMYVGKRQAQNAADAGALSAAIHLMEQGDDLAGARVSAQTFARQNGVMGELLDPAEISVDLPIPCPPGTGTSGISCVKVDLHHVLPTSFARLVDINSQGIAATATAQLIGANQADCLRPWFVLDKPAPGYTTDDIGDTFVLDSRITPSGFGKIDVGSGENDVVNSVHHCVDNPGDFAIGETVPTQTGAAGNPTAKAVNDVIDWDPTAYYDPITKTIKDSCAPNCYCNGDICPNAAKGMSPRVFVAPLCDPVADTGCVSGGNGSTHTITITKFLSFFVTFAQAHGNDIEIRAILVGGAGDLGPGEGSPVESAFLKIVRLVR